jgi:cellulose synthase operon protein C
MWWCVWLAASFVSSADADALHAQAMVGEGPDAQAAWIGADEAMRHHTTGDRLRHHQKMQQAKDPTVRAWSALAMAPFVADPSTLLDGAGIPRTMQVMGPVPTADDVQPAATTTEWSLLSRTIEGGFRPFERWMPQERASAWLSFVVSVARAQVLHLHAGSGGSLRVLVDGVLVHDHATQRRAHADQDVVAVRVPAGPHEVRMLVSSARFGGEVWMRVTNANGTPLPPSSFSAPVPRQEVRPSTRVQVVALPKSEDVQRMRFTRNQDEDAQPTRLQTMMAAMMVRGGLDRSRAALWAAQDVATKDVNRAHELAVLAVEEPATKGDACLLLFQLASNNDAAGDALPWLSCAKQALPSSVLVRRAEAEWMQDRGGLVDQLAQFERDASNLDDGDAAMAHAQALLAAGRPADAHRVVAAAVVAIDDKLRIEEEALRAQWLVADSQQADGVRAALVANLKQQQQRHPSSHRITRALCALLDEADAVRVAQEHQRAWPQKADASLLLADVLLRAQRRDDAVAALTHAAELAPQNEQVRQWRSQLRGQDEPLVSFFADAPTRPTTPTPGAEGGRIWRAGTAMRILQNGLGRVVEDMWIEVIDEQGTRGLERFVYGYQAEREELEVLVAERLRGGTSSRASIRTSTQAGGNADYHDAAIVEVKMPSLVVGDLVHIRLRRSLVGATNWFGDFFGQRVPLGYRMPVEQWVCVVQVDEGRALSFSTPLQPPTITRQDGVVTHRFEAAHLPAIVSEPNMPPAGEVTPVFSISTYQDWAALGAWYEGFVAPQLVLDDELRAVAAKAKQQHEEPAERVRALYEYVVTQTRYVALELGIHGWKPYPVTQVHRRKYGDCKDKASLLVSLLREASIPANLVLVRTSHQGRADPSPPSMWLFDHAIAYVPQLDLLLDGTAEFSGVHELPEMDQGALALVVGAHGKQAVSVVRTLPTTTSTDNRNESDYTLTLQADGSMHVQGSERFVGVRAAQERRRLLDEENRKQSLQKELSTTMQGIVVDSMRVTNLDLGTRSVGYDFVARVPLWARPDGGNAGRRTLPLSLYPHHLAEAYASTSKRTTDVVVGHAWSTINRMRFVLPAGVRLLALPESHEIDDAVLRFSSHVEPTADGFVLVEETHVKQARIAPSDYARVRSLMQQADAWMGRTLQWESVP